MTLVLAFNYGGRAEIVDAARKLIVNGVPADSLDEKTFAKFLYNAGLPDVDLLYPHRRRDTHQQFPYLAGRLRRILLHARSLAGF